MSKKIKNKEIKKMIERIPERVNPRFVESMKLPKDFNELKEIIKLALESQAKLIKQELLNKFDDMIQNE